MKISSKFAWFICSVFVLYQFLLQISPSVMIPELESSLKLNSSGIGILTSIFFYTYLAFQIPAGILIDKFGVRKVVGTSILLTSCSVVIFAMSNSYLTICVSRFATGAFCACSVPAAMYIAGRTFEHKYFPLLAGLTEMLGMLGGALGQIILAHFVREIGYKETIYLSAIIGLVIGIILIISCSKNLRAKGNSHTIKDLVCPGGEVCCRHQRKKIFLQLLFSKQLFTNGVMSGILFAPIVSFGGLWAIPYISLAKHISHLEAAFISSFVFFGAALGTPLLGKISNTIRHRKILMLYGAIISFILISSILYIHHIPIPILCFMLFLLGFFSSTYVIAFTITQESFCGQKKCSAMAFTNTFSVVVGTILLQPLIGLFIEKPKILNTILNMQNISMYWRYNIALSVIPILLLISLLIYPFIKETGKISCID